MQTLLELAPLILFFAAWKFTDIYIATAVLMTGMLLLVLWDWVSTRTIPKMHLVSAMLYWVFGAATLLLHDGSVWIGRITVLERLMGAAIPAGHKVAPATWRNASLVSALFYTALGGANLWVMYTMTEKAWVFFKTWICVPLGLIYTVGIVFWLLRGYEAKDEPEDEPKAPA
jgi:intracellular septation protein